jgi:acetyl-CoA carboxylase biotin carboxyl carrier protein
MAPGPEAPSFIQKGTNVQVGDTILIIEAMKVMNHIKAERAGTVTQILVQNGQPVEFGDVLVVIE